MISRMRSLCAAASASRHSTGRRLVVVEDDDRDVVGEGVELGAHWRSSILSSRAAQERPAREHPESKRTGAVIRQDVSVRISSTCAAHRRLAQRGLGLPFLRLREHVLVGELGCSGRPTSRAWRKARRAGRRTRLPVSPFWRAARSGFGELAPRHPRFGCQTRRLAPRGARRAAWKSPARRTCWSITRPRARRTVGETVPARCDKVVQLRSLGEEGRKAPEGGRSAPEIVHERRRIVERDLRHQIGLGGRAPVETETVGNVVDEMAASPLHELWTHASRPGAS